MKLLSSSKIPSIKIEKTLLERESERSYHTRSTCNSCCQLKEVSEANYHEKEKKSTVAKINKIYQFLSLLLSKAA